MSRNRIRQNCAAGLAALTLLSGCSAAAGLKDAAQEVVTGNCHDDHPYTVVFLDGTNSAADQSLIDRKADVVAAVARDVSDRCGFLTVEIFGSTSTDRETIVDARNLTPDGEHDGERAENRAAEVDPVVGTVRAALEGHAPREGTAALGVLAAGARLLDEVDDDLTPELYVLTDGLETEALELRKLVNAGRDAGALVEMVAEDAPDLGGVRVTVAGIGLVSDGVKPTSFTDTLLEFYDRYVCGEAKANPCTVTDGLSVEVTR